MPKYKLIYFDASGRAETSRLLFTQAGVDFEDFRFGRDQWPKIKPDMPFGSVPVLEIDGEKLCQSGAIEWYLANKFGLAGKTDWDKARVLMTCGCLGDIVQPLVTAIQEKDETRKAEMKKRYQDEQLPDFWAKLEKLLKCNKGGDGYFVGDEVTLADLHFFTVFLFFPFGGINYNLDPFPKLKALKERVAALPRIAAYYKK